MTERQRKLEAGELPDERESTGRRRFDKALPVITLAMGVLALVSIVVAIGASRAAHEASDATVRAEKALKEIKEGQGSLYRAELRACQRVQGLREEVNIVTDIIYRVLIGTTQGAAASDNPGSRERAEFFRFLTRLLAYQPPTDCPNAVADQKYTRPDEVPWKQIRGNDPDELRGRVGVP